MVPVRFQVTIEKTEPNDRLILTDRSGAFFTGPVGRGDGWNGNVYRFERPFAQDQQNFVRAEVRQQDGKTMKSLCNPVYLPAKNATARK